MISQDEEVKLVSGLRPTESYDHPPEGTGITDIHVIFADKIAFSVIYKAWTDSLGLLQVV